jgi:DNA invertase Pin-like site-specific DNA recombinase
MRVGIYARVSTLIGQSPEMQLAELREYASRRSWEIYDEYVDSGVSGSKESRPVTRSHLCGREIVDFRSLGSRTFMR